MKQDIKYQSGRDFDTLRQEFYNYIAKVFPEHVNNFRTAQFGRALLQLLAYDGALLHYAQDRQYEQIVLNPNASLETLYRIAYEHGWRLKGPTNAICEGVEVSVLVPATTGVGKKIPDISYLPKIENLVAVAENGTYFSPDTEIHFGRLSNRLIENENYKAELFDETTGEVTYFRVTLPVTMTAGEIKLVSHFFSSYERFLTYTLEDENISEIISIRDDDAEIWYEVSFLTQDFVYQAIYNTTEHIYNLHYKRTDKRFMAEYNPNDDLLKLIFGPGNASSEMLFTDIRQSTMPLFGNQNLGDVAFNANNYYNSTALGLSPYNKTLFIRYRVGSGSEGNVGMGEVNSVETSDVSFLQTGLNGAKMQAVRDSVAVYNPNKASGGRDKFETQDLLYILPSYIQSQMRCVEMKDYLAKIYSMPVGFGSVSKVSVSEDRHNTNALDIFVLSLDNDDKLTTASTLIKRNISNYLRENYGGSYHLYDAQIINIGVKMTLRVEENFSDSKSLLLNSVLDFLIDWFDISKWQIGQKINKKKLEFDILNEFKNSVEAVVELKVYHKDGNLSAYTNYNSVSMKGFNLSNYVDEKQIYCPSNCIFEVKYPEVDIEIKITN